LIKTRRTQMNKKNYIVYSICLFIVAGVVTFCAMISCDNHNIMELIRATNEVEENPTPAPTPNRAPDPPSSPQPADGAAGVSLDTQLCVDVSDPDVDTMNVTFYVGEQDSVDFDQSGTVQDIPDGATACIPYTFPSCETAYEWYAVACDGWEACTQSDTFDLTTEASSTTTPTPTPTPTPPNRSPDPPSNPQPADKATSVILETDLCVYVSDPDGDTMDVAFSLKVKGAPVTPQPLPSATGIPSGTRVCTPPLSGLLFDTTYEWTAEAFDSALSASSTFSFTTMGINDLITNPRPADGATGVGTNPTLSVNVQYPTGLNVAFRGKVQGPEGEFKDIGTDSAGQGFPASVTWQNLDYMTTYAWYITIDGYLQSDTWTFTTGENHAPGTPSNPQPPHGAWDVGIDPDLCVDVSDPDGDTMNVTFYDMMDCPIATATQVPSGGKACVQWNGLSPNSPYAWSAEANDGDKSTKSPQWSFNTGPTPPPGPAVHCEGSCVIYLRNAPECEGGVLTKIECDVETGQTVTDIVGAYDWEQVGTHVTVWFYCVIGPEFVIQGIASCPTNFKLNGTPIGTED
jgi:hypothetical protein